MLKHCLKGTGDLARAKKEVSFSPHIKGLLTKL